MTLSKSNIEILDLQIIYVLKILDLVIEIKRKNIRGPKVS